MEPFEEIVAGAGRIDLYLKFAGGLSIVVEIKMCGGSYSSAYAAAGEQQITHYMENKGTKLGYLLVFDGRTRDFGKRVLSGRRSGLQSLSDLWMLGLALVAKKPSGRRPSGTFSSFMRRREK